MAETTHSSDAAYAAKEASSGGLPQFDFSTWGSQIFWLIITFGVLYFVLSKFILPALSTGITERSDRIADDLDAAARMQRDAEQAEADYNEQLSDARAKAHNIAATTRSSVDAEIAAEVEAADADMARQQASNEARIAQMRSEALGNVDTLAQTAVKDIVGKIAGLKPSAAAIKSAVSKA